MDDEPGPEGGGVLASGSTGGEGEGEGEGEGGCRAFAGEGGPTSPPLTP